MAMLREKILSDCGVFSEEVFGFQNAVFQWEWYSVLSNQSLRSIVLAAPRGHTKSSCFSVVYPSWEIARNPNVRILLVSGAESQSQSFLREVTGRMERDPHFIDFMGGQIKPDEPEKWTDREIIVERPNLNLKDPTLSTVGVGGTILSKRADIIICDDILNPENTRTPAQRQKLKEWFYQVLMPVLVPGGRLIFVGTVWNPQDLLTELLKDPSFDYRKRFKAVLEEPTHDELWKQWYSIRLQGTETSKAEADAFMEANKEKMNEGIQVLWPEMFPYRILYPIKRSNSAAFEKMYQNNIISREDQKFKEEWLERAKERGSNYRLVRSLDPDARKSFVAVTAGIDLAASENEQGDDNVNLHLGLRKTDDMVMVLSIDRGKFTPAVWRSTVAERHDHMRPDRMVVETNGYQAAMKRDLADKNLPIVAFHTGGEKLDPYIGVESLAIMFENDRIILPYDKSDPYTIALIDQLVDELRLFPGGHTGDSVMAFWFAYTALRDLTAGRRSGFMSIVNEDIKAGKTEELAKPPGLSGWVNLANGGTPL